MAKPSKNQLQIRILGRSFLALVLSPEAPLEAWLKSLDKQIQRSASFFLGKPIILNLERVSETEEGLSDLYNELMTRNIQIISIENISTVCNAIQTWPKLGIFSNGKTVDPIHILDKTKPKPPTAPYHIIEEPVRSGQSIFFPEGDVIITNSVSSGSEIVAGGSIHVYGALRGRAIAGINGQPKARIFAYQLEAELMAIDGYYMTAEEIPENLILKPAQVYLDQNVMTVAPLMKMKS
ncbi:Septum site-determining protein MinC [Commensalibacter sp. Nvir]|uniref:septum site-determining protein MinC n=1 Tax=Commensalibacter sp. Nvir TaxID=3069817 RepID=UPI002D43043B|nr:Septum site-determining protein MinC [Commensalibacter sp. Nvir]